MALEPWAWGPGCGAGTPRSSDILPDFYLPHIGVEQPVLCLRPPTSSSIS